MYIIVSNSASHLRGSEPGPQSAQPPPSPGRHWPAVVVRKRARHIPLQEDEEPPPPESLEGVVLVPSLENGDVGHGVVHGPGPGGDPVAQQHINAVVTMPKEKSRDAGQEETKGEPMEHRKLLKTVCKEESKI